MREALTDSQRAEFDRHVDAVVARLPPRLHALMEEIPLIVEDQPSSQQMVAMNLEDPDDLCGLYTGVPLTLRSIEQSGIVNDQVFLFRRGVLRMATSARGEVNPRELRRQIRLTILHEFGHHHGMGEAELEDLGY